MIYCPLPSGLRARRDSVLLILLVPVALAVMAAAPAAEREIRSQAQTYVVMNSIERFIFRRPGAVEPFSVHHAIFIKSSVAEVVRDAPNRDLAADDPTQRISTTALAETHFCRWSFETYLQRQTCFTSISGVAGCTDPVTMQQPDVESGDYEFDPTRQDEPACNDTHPLVATAQERAEKRVREQGAALMSADTRTQVLAGARKLGLVVEAR